MHAENQQGAVDRVVRVDRISQLPGQCHALWMGLRTEIGWTPRRRDGTMMDEYGCVVASVAVGTASDWFRCGQVSLFLLRASMPASLSMASTGFFESKTCSLSVLPPGSQGPGPSQVDRTTSCDGSRGGQLGSHSPSFGSPCGVVPRSRSPSGNSALACSRSPLPAGYREEVW